MSTSWGFESGSDGDALTTTNTNSDNVVVTGGSGEISTDQAHSGTRSMHLTGTSTNSVVALMKNFASTGPTIDFYVYWATLPSAELTLVRVFDGVGATGNTCWSLNANNVGRLRLYDASGTSVWLGGTATGNRMVTGTWYHITVTAAQSSSAGSLSVTLDDVTAGTTIDSSASGGTWSGTNGSLDTGANAYASFRLGIKAASSATTGEAYFDDYTFDEGTAPSTDLGFYVYSGGEWVHAVANVYDGSAWATADAASN